jgi:hypothetical protein
LAGGEIRQLLRYSGMKPTGTPIFGSTAGWQRFASRMTSGVRRRYRKRQPYLARNAPPQDGQFTASHRRADKDMSVLRCICCARRVGSHLALGRSSNGARIRRGAIEACSRH